MRRIAAAVSLVTLAFSVAAAATAQTAGAEPATTTRYPVSAASTHYTGQAFDACAAPSLATMTAWGASPYRAIGVYAGGENRTCAQPNLTAEWVGTVAASGWRLLPIYIGPQAPCTHRTSATRITASRAATQGTAAATDAIASVAALGMTPGSAIYYDMENYDDNDASCRTAVLDFLSSYTRELHRRGYLSGVYGNLGSLAAHLTAAYTDARWARPDVLWLARWDGAAKLTGYKGVPDTYWGTHQRVKQYVGDHVETYGGVSITIDTNYLDAPVATVVRTYTATGTTNLRAEPKLSGLSRGTTASGNLLAVLCQTSGGTRNGTKVWDKLADGSYISDSYVSTPSKTGFSTGVARCYYPYQVTVTKTLARRSSAKSSAKAIGAIRTGGLAWVSCQKPGAKVKSTRVWDLVAGGGYVPDYYVANASNKTYSSPAPRC